MVLITETNEVFSKCKEKYIGDRSIADCIVECEHDSVRVLHGN